MDIASAPNFEKYVGKDHKCYLKKVEAKDGYCTAGNKEPCKNNHSIKKMDWRHSCRTYTEKYIFYDSKLPKTQVPTLLTSQSHKTSKETNTCTTVSRNSVKLHK